MEVPLIDDGAGFLDGAGGEDGRLQDAAALIARCAA